MKPSVTRDEELARLAGDGDEAAVRVLIERHRTELEARVRRRMPAALNRRVAVSDVVQDCYAAAFHRIVDFEDRGEGSFGRWLGTILEYKLRDSIRTHLGRSKRTANRELSRDGRRDTHAFEGSVATPGERAVDREQRKLVIDALADMPGDHRIILRLIHDAGLSVPEAAEQLGRSSEATRKLYSRAVAHLARQLRGKLATGRGDAR